MRNAEAILFFEFSTFSLVLNRHFYFLNRFFPNLFVSVIIAVFDGSLNDFLGLIKCHKKVVVLC